ncbi:hypothetical protein T4A_3202 [Trichinella pseudospiralis]|uniref:Uncharacterized protein n=1 Tax=Trichinella pseudospiralis TaxID=6337 RepID=A0A0V1E1V3_TRIPS|nr:hypothetical protein T4A_3202 [Trichinella pseudospiralis]
MAAMADSVEDGHVHGNARPTRQSGVVPVRNSAGAICCSTAIGHCESSNLDLSCCS